MKLTVIEQKIMSEESNKSDPLTARIKTFQQNGFWKDGLTNTNSAN